MNLTDVTGLITALFGAGAGGAAITGFRRWLRERDARIRANERITVLYEQSAATITAKNHEIEELRAENQRLRQLIDELRRGTKST